MWSVATPSGICVDIALSLDNILAVQVCCVPLLVCCTLGLQTVAAGSTRVCCEAFKRKHNVTLVAGDVAIEWVRCVCGLL
jgi:hypothetical protein